MPLADDFIFSQNNLQDYVDCPQRFELRYIHRIQWPSIQVEPVLELERQMQQGKSFHLLIQQDLTGLPRDLLGELAFQQGLSDWWNNFLSSDPTSPFPGQRYPEFQLSTNLAGKRITAKYDLIIRTTDRLAIFDWKTSTKKTAAQILIKRLQSLVYPLVAVEAAQSINNNLSIKPEQVQMVYWFANFPNDSTVLHFSTQQYHEAKNLLSDLLNEITTRKDGQFPLTPDEKRCQYCNYRTLCNRGTQTGSITEIEDIDTYSGYQTSELNFEQIGEIGF